MLQKQGEQRSTRKKISFSFHAPQAEEVLLAGDFNQWNGRKHYMKKGKQGTWQKTLMLKPKSYEYKYIVDGEWQLDPKNHQSCLNPFGSHNNKLTVTD